MTDRPRRWLAWIAVVTAGLLLWLYFLNNADPSAARNTAGMSSGATASAPDHATAAQPTADPEKDHASSRLPVTAAADDGAAQAATANDFRTSLLVRTFTTEGVPLPGCLMVLTPARVDRWEVVEDLSLTEGPEGEHRAHGFPPGQYHLACAAPFRSAPFTTIVWEPGRSETVDVKIADLADLVSGVVSLPSGEPVVGAFVREANNGSRLLCSITNENGRFLLLRATGNTANNAELLLADELGDALIADAPTTTVLPWGSLNSSVVGRRRAAVQVFLRDENGKAVPRFHVSSLSDTPLALVARNAPGTDGVAILNGMPRGAASLTIVPEDCGLPVWQQISVAPDGSATVHCTIRAGVRLRGTVRSASGAPVAGAVATLELIDAANNNKSESPVAAEWQGKPGLRSVRCVVANDEFAFVADPHVAYRLRVKAPRHNVFECKVQAIEQEFPDITITLLPTSSLRTSLQPPEAAGWLTTYRRQTGKREHGCVSLVATGRRPDAEPEYLLLDPGADGTIHFEDLSAGRWLLWLKGPTRPQLIATLELEPGQEHELPPIDLEHLRPGSLEVKITMEPAEMTPIRVACAARGEKLELPIRSDGSFRLEAPGGSYLLRFAFSTPAGPKTVIYTNPVLVQAGAEAREHIQLGMQKLKIQALDNTTGQPIPSLTVSIDEERATGTFMPLQTDASGHASWDPGPCGDFGLSWLDQASNQWKSIQRTNATAEQPIVLRIVR